MSNWRGTRSWREFRVAFFVSLVLLCAGRVWERVTMLLVKPIAAQRAMFGRIVVDPWKAEDVRVTFGEDGVDASWQFMSPSFPTPTARCRPDAGRDQSASSYHQMCWLKLGRDNYRADWDHGVLTINLYPPHTLS